MYKKERLAQAFAMSFVAMYPVTAASSVLDRDGQCPLTDCYNIRCGFQSFEFSSDDTGSSLNPEVGYEFEALCEAIWINNPIILVPATVRGTYDHATKKVAEIAEVGGPFRGEVLTTATCEEDPYLNGNDSCSGFAWHVNLDQGNEWYPGLDERRLPFGEGKISQGMIDEFLEKTGKAQEALTESDLSKWNPYGGASKPRSLEIDKPGNFHYVKVCDPPGVCARLVLSPLGVTAPLKVEGEFQKLIDQVEVYGDIAMPKDKPYPVWQAINGPLKPGYTVAWSELSTARKKAARHKQGSRLAAKQRDRKLTEAGRRSTAERSRSLLAKQNLRAAAKRNERSVPLYTGNANAPFTPGLYRVRVRGTTGDATG